MSDREANSAQIAEIRGRAEDALKYGEPSGFGQLARDVLALVEVAEAADAALKTRAIWGDITVPERVRLEEALSKFDLGGL